MATPEVASVAVSVKETAEVNQPFDPLGLGGVVASEVEGPTSSSLIWTDFVDSTLPAVSVDRNVIVWSPWVASVTAPPYVVGAPPSTV